MVPPKGEDTADGFRGGIAADGEFSVKESIEEGLGEFEYDVGEGKAEPVEAYTGRSSS
ncbi:hypothetical protein A2U01_0023273, partial [Trifolium medium]|nr:hypothetical protein [Trifolium medium]